MILAHRAGRWSLLHAAWSDNLVYWMTTTHRSVYVHDYLTVTGWRVAGRWSIAMLDKNIEWLQPSHMIDLLNMLIQHANMQGKWHGHMQDARTVYMHVHIVDDMHVSTWLLYV